MTLQTQLDTQAETIARLIAKNLRLEERLKASDRREEYHLRIIEKQAHTIEQYRKQADPAAMARAIFKEHG